MRDDLDFNSRELCPDGACIGVIGTNGKCKVCGKPGTSTPFRTPADSPDPTSAQPENENALDHEHDPDPAAADSDDSESDSDESDSDESDSDESDSDALEASADADADAGAGAGAKAAWDDRRLCPDDTCIGLLGANGRCKVCGR